MRSVLTVLVLTACGGAQSSTVAALEAPPPETVWVVAPHPDDELLMAGQLLHTLARSGRPYEIAIVTNGDLSCERDGWARQIESITALSVIGVPETHVHFLGYPDGYLDQLGTSPLPLLERRNADRTCGAGNTTYGTRGAESMDVHTAHHGRPASYLAAELEQDLALLFAWSPPAQIHLPHPIDEHPDHAMTYAFVRRVLEDATYEPPSLHRHVVHAGPCWPASDAAGACVPPSPALDATPLPPLPPPLGAYAPDVVLSADPVLRRISIGLYETQLGGPRETSWLASFARTTEVAWTERLRRSGGALRPELGGPGAVTEGRWRAPIELRAEAGEATLVLSGDGGRRYELECTPNEVRLFRVAGAERVPLRAIGWPAETQRSVRFAVIPVAGGFAQLEVSTEAGLVLAAIDVAPILEGPAPEPRPDLTLRALE